MLSNAAAVACAGIVVGSINISGAGLSFSNFVISAAQDTLLLALILSMVAGIILGMGMPTTPAYIVQVALLVPALVNLGVRVEAAHLFVFYFAILSAITPPVAMAVYAANAISGARVWEASIGAVKLDPTGFIIPFLFVYEPTILLLGEPMQITFTITEAVFGVIMLAASLHGYLLAPLKRWQQILLFFGALGLIFPGWIATIPAIIILVLVVMTSRVNKNLLEPMAESAD